MIPALVTDVVGVTRSLGDVGIKSIIVTEYALSPSLWSRHCLRSVLVPSMGEEKEQTLRIVTELGRSLSDAPVVMVGRESDVEFFSTYRAELSSHFRIKMAPTDLMAALNDKWGFAKLAEKNGLSVPKSWHPTNEKEFEAAISEIDFPCILKPFSQGVWCREEIYAILGRWRKARIVETRHELENLYQQLSRVDLQFIIQEYIPGADDSLYSLHAYCPKPGNVAGYFVGRKIRTNPIHFGRGSYTRSFHDHEIARVGVSALEKIGYVGAAGINLKKDPQTGRTVILEINPRFSLWCHLASRSGVNLPHAMYNDCLDLPLPELKQDSRERRWLYFYIDVQAFKKYRLEGEWTFRSWIRSFFFPRITFFRWDVRDPLPLCGALWGYVWLRLKLRIQNIFKGTF